MKITAKFGRASRRLRFEDTKRIMSSEMRPKSLGTLEKRALGLVRAGDIQYWLSCRENARLLRKMACDNPSLTLLRMLDGKTSFKTQKVAHQKIICEYSHLVRSLATINNSSAFYRQK